MPAGRRRKAARWTLRRLAAAAGVIVTVGMIPIASVSQLTTPDDPRVRTALAPAPDAARADLRASRSGPRSGPRPERPTPDQRTLVAAVEAAVQLSPRWTTAPLNVWARPGEGSRRLTVLDPSVKVRFTGTVRGPWAEIQHRGRTAWVRRAYLVAKKPRPDPIRQFAGVTGSSCPDGSSVESGLQPNTVKVYRAVCAAFPAVSGWGGLSGSGNHGAGRALDIMSSGSLGDAIADYVRSRASALGASEVLYARRIWTVQRGSEGWRAMEDRGSSTANHYDHVHVSVF